MYRRTHTCSDLAPRPPHFVYIVRCSWTGNPVATETETTLGGSRSGRGRTLSPTRSPRSPSPGSPRLSNHTGGDPPWRDDRKWEAPWPWWEQLPQSYVITRKWTDIVRFHEALKHDLAFDHEAGCRRTKARVPKLPDRGDVDTWLCRYATIGDACALGRKLPLKGRSVIRERGLDELEDLHWIYTENRLSPYFEEVNKVLLELPTQIVATSIALRRFATTGGVGGRRSLPSKSLTSRFLGPLKPVRLEKEELVSAVRALHRAQSASALSIKPTDGKVMPKDEADKSGRASPARSGGRG